MRRTRATLIPCVPRHEMAAVHGVIPAQERAKKSAKRLWQAEIRSGCHPRACGDLTQSLVP